MLKVKLGGLGLSYVRVKGDTRRVVTDICFVINAIYNRMLKDDPSVGAEFKRGLIGAISDADSPVRRTDE